MESVYNVNQVYYYQLLVIVTRLIAQIPNTIVPYYPVLYVRIIVTHAHLEVMSALPALAPTT